MLRLRDRKVPTDLLIGASISAVALVLLIPMIALISTRKASEVALTNLHRISQAMLLYTEGYDEHFPLGDTCLAGSSMNAVLDQNRHFASEGCGIRTYDRINIDHWQKWLEVYFDNDSVFLNPLREREPLAWEANGVLANGFLVNTGLLGLIPTDPSIDGQAHLSWHGGVMSGVVNPKAALLILDLPSYNAFLPILADKASGTAYPMAVREYYQYMVHAGTLNSCMDGELGTTPDLQKAPMNGVNRVSANGNALFLPAEDFLEMTPTKQDFGIPGGLSRADLDCRALSPSSRSVLTLPNLKVPTGFPLWDMP